MLRRTLTALALCLAALLALAGPASAGEEYTPPPGIEVDNDTPEPGDSVTITGEGCEVGAEVSITLDGVEVATATIGEDGTFSATFDVPADAEPGDYEVQVIGCGTEVLSSIITVGGAVTTTSIGGAALPQTGSSSTEPLVRTGAVLVAAGGVLVYAVRRRQQAAA